MADTVDDLLSQVVYQIQQNQLFGGFSMIKIRNPNQKFGGGSGDWERFRKSAMPICFVQIGKRQESNDRTFANYRLKNSITMRRYQVWTIAAMNQGWLATS